MIGGGTSAVTGYLLLFPFYAAGIEGMQIAQVIHAVVAMLFIAAMLGRTSTSAPSACKGAFEAMGEGSVDVNWAKSITALWLEEELRRTPEGARAQPAEISRNQHVLRKTPGFKPGRFAIRGHAHYRSRRLEWFRQNHADNQVDPAAYCAPGQGLNCSSTPITDSDLDQPGRICSFIAPPVQPKSSFHLRNAGPFCTSCVMRPNGICATWSRRCRPSTSVLVEGFKRDAFPEA